MIPSSAVPSSGDVVARVDFQYRWRTWALLLLLLGTGIWCIRDGFIDWPRENAAWARMDERVDRPSKPPHENAGVLFNQIFGVLLTALSIPITAWRAYQSRGEYRLAGNTIHVPGRLPISFDQIRGLDLVRWDRKGIAMVEYEAPGRGSRSFTLNDMIYERNATDQIVDRIETHLNAQDAPAADPGSAT